MNIVFFIFNRPLETRASFDVIRAAKPERLLIVADGPRDSRPNEKQLCEETRAIVADIDWPCEVSRDFSDVNLGCGLRVSSGLDWAFSHVENAIILEDDCVPNPSFFPFCTELLTKYRNDDRVMMVSGRSHVTADRLPNDESYYFSRIPRCWGWATWRRAWAKYDYRLKERQRGRDLKILPGNLFYRVEMRHVVDQTLSGAIDTWDYQWLYTISRYNGVCITPAKNLVSNIGFNERGTHTLSEDARIKNITNQIVFPLCHPSSISVLEALDEAERRLFHRRSVKQLFRQSNFRRWWRENIKRKRS